MAKKRKSRGGAVKVKGYSYTRKGKTIKVAGYRRHKGGKRGAPGVILGGKWMSKAAWRRLRR